MPAPDLTDADRAEIAKIDGYAWTNQHTFEEIYRSGLAAGRARAIEDCAKVCESYALQVGDKYYGTSNGKQCAAALRALLK
jgi:hypothetical protein